MILKRRTVAEHRVGRHRRAACRSSSAGPSVTNSLSWAPVILFLVMFFWTPPHYWPLSMKVKEDYARVGVPMLPVVASNKVVARQIVIYSWVMVAVSLLLTPLGYTGWFYTAVALLAGGLWLWEAHGLQNRAKAEVTGAQAQGDAAVPLVDHLCVDAVRGGRGGSLPALTPSRSPICRDGRGTWSRPRHPARRQFDLPVGSILAMADTQQVDEAADAKQAARPSAGRPGSPSRSAPSPRRTAAPRARSRTSGERGTRIVLVGEDGGWGDLVAPSYAIAEQAVEKAGHHPPRVLRRRVRGQGADRPVRVDAAWRASRSAARATPERAEVDPRSGPRGVREQHLTPGSPVRTCGHTVRTGARMIETPSLVDQYCHGVLRTELGLGTFEAQLARTEGPPAAGHHPLRHPDRFRRTPLVPAAARPGTALPARPLSRPPP